MMAALATVACLAAVVPAGETSVASAASSGAGACPDSLSWPSESREVATDAVDFSSRDYVVSPAIEPYEIIAGPDAAMWFTGFDAAKIGRLTQDGSLATFDVPEGDPRGGPVLAAGADGNIWFGEQDYIGVMSVEGDVISRFPIKGVANDLELGPDGNYWFPYQYPQRKLGRVSPSGEVTDFGPLKGSAFFLSAGADGNIWFTEKNGSDYIGCITTSGAMREYRVPAGRGAPVGVTEGPDGAAWITLRSSQGVFSLAPPGSSGAEGSRMSAWRGSTPAPSHAAALPHGAIARIAPSGDVTEYELPSTFDDPQAITLGADGNLWFAQWFTNLVGRLTPTGVFTEFALPPRGRNVLELAVGPDGDIWVADAGLGTIARVDLDSFRSCTLLGTDGPDVLEGTELSDVICGRGGDDLISAGGGDDTIIGGAGTDTLSYADAPNAVEVDLPAERASGDGTDKVVSIEGLQGSGYDDRLVGGEDTVDYDGGAGHDTIIAPEEGPASWIDYSGAAGPLSFTADADVVEVAGAERDTLINIYGLTGSPFDDRLVAGDRVVVPRFDTLQYFSAGRGDDFALLRGVDVSFSGGQGRDVVTYEELELADDEYLVVDLSRPFSGGFIFSDVGGGGSGLGSVEVLIGSRWSDSISGNGSDNDLRGGRGHDDICGRRGDDLLRGQQGSDTLEGGPGRDSLWGGPGADKKRQGPAGRAYRVVPYGVIACEPMY